MRSALSRNLGLLGVLIALLACVIACIPQNAGVKLPGSTVKVVTKTGHGSGVHIGNGYIVSAAHVMSDGVSLKLDNGAEQPAEVLWVNQANDIALLRTEATMQASALDCRVARMGEPITARGNPRDLEFVASSGFVAGSEREIGPWKRALPLDLSIVMGMSGGASFGPDGRVVGINVGVMLASVGISPSLTGFGVMVPAAVVCDLMGKGALT